MACKRNVRCKPSSILNDPNSRMLSFMELPPLLNTPPYTYVEVKNGQKETLQLLRR